MDKQEQAKFEGWAVVEMMGHQREIGFVTTEYFGGAALFRVDTPEIAEREVELKRPEYLTIEGSYRMMPKGSKVKRVAIPAKSRFVSPSALYALTPCTEETALHAIEEMVQRNYILLSIPEGEQKQLVSTLPGEDESYMDDFDGADQQQA